MRLLRICVAVLTLLSGASGPAWAEAVASTVDFILVEKGERRMTLFSGNDAVRTYRIALGRGGLAAKRREGDRLTPEGRYRIDLKHPGSEYHLALRISYPNAEDRARAAVRKVPPGGNIMIHGLPNGLETEPKLFRNRDWTAGCIDVMNEEIEEIWSLVEVGTDIEIRR